MVREVSKETSAASTGDKDEEPEGEVECAICFEVNNTIIIDNT